jgi:hypothetical protein
LLGFFSVRFDYLDCVDDLFNFSILFGFFFFKFASALVGGKANKGETIGRLGLVRKDKSPQRTVL